MSNLGYSTGGTSIEKLFDKRGGYKVISIGSFSENNQYNDQNIRVGYSDLIKDRILNKDDIVMILNDKTQGANILGKALIIENNDEYVYNQRVQRLEIYKDNFLPKFLYILLNANKIRNKLIKLAQGNTQIYVNWSNISQIEYAIPCYEEQAKISSLFSNLDSLITLHQRGYKWRENKWKKTIYCYTNIFKIE
ncbi:restriction endonuclease subunit S [Mycoplasma capricolum]|uniref:restriction endonuclease subunit S n=1 Tax=Mycoplasma capricolum TaxID=2095 RepID=UPI003DA5EA33